MKTISCVLWASALWKNPRLVRVTVCLSLLEAVREYNGSHAGFLVRKKHFVYYLESSRDGIAVVNCNGAVPPMPDCRISIVFTEIVSTSTRQKCRHNSKGDHHSTGGRGHSDRSRACH